MLPVTNTLHHNLPHNLLSGDTVLFQNGHEAFCPECPSVILGLIFRSPVFCCQLPNKWHAHRLRQKQVRLSQTVDGMLRRLRHCWGIHFLFPHHRSSSQAYNQTSSTSDLLPSSRDLINPLRHNYRAPPWETSRVHLKWIMNPVCHSWLAAMLTMWSLFRVQLLYLQ